MDTVIATRLSLWILKSRAIAAPAGALILDVTGEMKVNAATTPAAVHFLRLGQLEQSFSDQTCHMDNKKPTFSDSQDRRGHPSRQLAPSENALECKRM